MRTFTLDTNCIVAIDEDRPEAKAIRALIDAQRLGKANVAVVAISASEKQQGGGYIQNFRDFQERLASLDLAHLEILKPMLYWGITFWDWSCFSSPDEIALEKKIHAALFPNMEFAWKDYCCANSLDLATSNPTGKWRNCKCDVQAVWSHIQNRRNVFVTSDSNFHVPEKKRCLIALGARCVESPEGAVRLLRSNSLQES